MPIVTSECCRICISIVIIYVIAAWDYRVNHFLRAPTHIAAEAGLAEVVKLFLSSGASDSIKVSWME